jgi:diketogulonate reductase-like aldo/keto reductase
MLKTALERNGTMSLDSYITLGNSGLRVSPFCLGTMTFGDDRGWGSNPSEAQAILASFLDRGGNFIDTANLYTYGHSEKIIGQYFAKNSARRQGTVISTKFFSNLHFKDPNGGGAGRKAIMAQLEHSLRRLQTDYVDVYWLHFVGQIHPNRRNDASSPQEVRPWRLGGACSPDIEGPDEIICQVGATSGAPRQQRVSSDAMRPQNCLLSPASAG